MSSGIDPEVFATLRQMGDIIQDTHAGEKQWIAYARERDEKIKEYRQTFLDIMRVAGDDVSELDHPDQLKYPDISVAALDAVKLLKEAYEECLDEGSH